MSWHSPKREVSGGSLNKKFNVENGIVSSQKHGPVGSILSLELWEFLCKILPEYRKLFEVVAVFLTETVIEFGK